MTNPLARDLNHIHLWTVGVSAAFTAAAAALIWVRCSLSELTPIQIVKINDATWTLISINSFVVIVMTILMRCRRQ